MSGRRLSGRKGGVCSDNGDRSLPVSLDMWDGLKAVGNIGVVSRLKTSSSMYTSAKTDHITVTDSSKC